MDKAEALENVKNLLPERRYQHTLGVVQAALELADRFGADRDKAELAAILHDIAKYFPEEEMVETIRSHAELDDELLNYHPSLWHAPVGALYVRDRLGVDDPEVLDAIRYHTTGRRGMTLLDKVVFLADYIEPGRDFPGVQEVRDIARTDLDAACAQALANTIRFLIEQYHDVYPDTLLAYNDLIKTTGRRLKDWKQRTGKSL